MMVSTEAWGFSFPMESQTFSACLRAKPKVSNADNASILLVLLVPEEIEDKPYTFNILSFRSRTNRCAVFAPIPLADWMVRKSLVAMASTICSGVKEDNMVLAVLAPTPETLISSLKTSLSTRVENPYSRCASSRTIKWVNNCTFSPGGRFEKVWNEISIKYPTPLQSITTSVGFFSTNLP